MGCCLGSELPSDAVPLGAQEEAAWIESLQGDWDIEAVDLEATGFKTVGFKTAKVTGQTYVMGGGPDGRSSKQTFSLTQSASTGLVYLDEWGSMPMTPGWPDTRPMRGQVGEVFDIKTPFACIRWMRRADTATATGFGQVQQPL
mmetsp:Transcript_81816/g.231897  ORF Transcript_81816/g.231897 Transcript_81816/m.231897 type:complete len:144 (+) Transcript_81816:121-552(+)